MVESPEQRIDLTGTPCPMNFVRIKEALDGMPPGMLLEALVDGGPVGRDVAESVSAAGYEVVSGREQGKTLLLELRRPGSKGRSIDSGLAARRRSRKPPCKQGRRHGRR